MALDELYSHHYIFSLPCVHSLVCFENKCTCGAVWNNSTSFEKWSECAGRAGQSTIHRKFRAVLNSKRASICCAVGLTHCCMQNPFWTLVVSPAAVSLHSNSWLHYSCVLIPVIIYRCYICPILYSDYIRIPLTTAGCQTKEVSDLIFNIRHALCSAARQKILKEW